MPTQQNVQNHGTGNIIIQMNGSGNSILLPDQPHLKLTRYLQRQQPLSHGEVRSEIDVMASYTRSIELQGREGEFDNLSKWLHQNSPFSIRVIVGEAGRGKTRLALELCETAFSKGWDCGFLTVSELRRFQSQNNAANWSWTNPTLIVVDYASTQASHIRDWLVELADHNALADKDTALSKPLRLLLLDRHADINSGWWVDMFGRTSGNARAVQQFLDPPEPMHLPPLSSLATRREILAQTLLSVGSGLEVPEVGTDVEFDTSLAKLEWGGEPLFLMMAALTAARCNFAEALTLSRTDLAISIAEREIENIEKLAVTLGISESAKSFISHMAGVVTLCQGLDYDAAIDAIEREKIALHRHNVGDAATIFGVLRRALPMTHTELSPIIPDVIGEALVICLWNEREGASATQRATMSGFLNRVVESIVRACQDFTASDYRAPLSWFDNIKNQYSGNLDDLRTISSILPHYTLELRERAVEVHEQIIQHLRNQQTSLQAKLDLAGYLNDLSIRLADTARPEDALSTISESVNIYRQLVEGPNDPNAFRLVGGLNNLSNRLYDLGRNREALNSIEEAISLLGSPPYTSALAKSKAALCLHTLSNRLAELGRYEEALVHIQQAVQLRRELNSSQKSPSDAAELAMSLNCLSNRLSDTGEIREALEFGQEAVKMYRKLSAHLPDSYRSELALNLNGLSRRYASLNRHDEASQTSSEAVSILFELSNARPKLFKSALAMCLNNQSNHLATVKQFSEAFNASKKAVEIERELTSSNPIHRGSLATSLATLSARLDEQGEHEDALTAIRESCDLFQDLAGEKHDAIQFDLIGVLNRLATKLSNVGRAPEALQNILVAIQRCRLLEPTHPDIAKVLLPTLLLTCASIRLSLRLLPEACNSSAEAVSRRIVLVKLLGNEFEPDLALAQNNHSNHLKECGRLDEAIKAGRAAVRIYRRLHRSQPSLYQGYLSGSVFNLSNHLAEAGHYEEALELNDESLELFESLDSDEKRVLTCKLPIYLAGRGQLQILTKDFHKAAVTFAKALDIISPYFLKTPYAYGNLTIQILESYLSACLASNSSPKVLMISQIKNELKKLNFTTTNHERMMREIGI